MDLDFPSTRGGEPYRLRGLDRFNVILGKNGCGKSTLLRSYDRNRGDTPIAYISPERGGQLIYRGQIESNMQEPNWLSDSRRTNSHREFREASVAQFRRLETLVLRKIEQDAALRADPNYTFENTIKQINGLLSNVVLTRSDTSSFRLKEKGTNNDAAADNLSSGESELISLAIEILSFAHASETDQNKDKKNWLLFDEPDVHLHPDLQDKLMKLLVTAIQGKPVSVLISTHSTAILSALTEHAGDVRVSFMANQQRDLSFEPATVGLKAVLPIFGAHPLSNVFNQRPILLVEGEDDERIWQQASRSSEGAIKIWPCSAGDIQTLNQYEQKANAVIAAVYENAKAYSLRDRDAEPYEIDNLGAVIRSRLNCRAAENLLVTDDVLALLGSNWDALKATIEQWIPLNPDHPQMNAATAFRDSDWNRREAGLKDLRNLIMGWVGSTKPWEIAVGQAIARLTQPDVPVGENSLTNYLGQKIVDSLNLRPA